MFKLKAALLGGAAALALATGAFSADIPARGPVYTKAPQAWSWEGQYIGVHGGYAGSDIDLNISGTTGATSPSGGFGGLQIGYNYHIRPNWILGYEIDVSFANLSDTSTFGGNTTTTNIDRFGTARTRLGYVQGPWMFYATGGLAWATLDMPINAGPFRERPQVGYAAGAGIEYAFAPNWSAKLEYIYMNFGDTNSEIVGGITNTDTTMSTVRLGLNYRFANWRAPATPTYFTKAPVYNAGWTGPYIGVHGGYGWGSFDAEVTGLSAQSFTPRGGFGGIQSGYNWQIASNWVVGLEGDASWGSISRVVGATNVDVDAMGTVRARLGYTMNNLMVYGTGGLAWAHADSNTFLAVRDQYYLGWAAGVGLEYAFAQRWSAKVEYLYADYGTIRDISGFNVNASLDVQTIKIGLNYRASFFELFAGR